MAKQGNFFFQMPSSIIYKSIEKNYNNITTTSIEVNDDYMVAHKKKNKMMLSFYLYKQTISVFSLQYRQLQDTTTHFKSF